MIMQHLAQFQSQTRRLLPRNAGWLCAWGGNFLVSIADATLASSQPRTTPVLAGTVIGFNRRRDACFLATSQRPRTSREPGRFNRRRDACFLATLSCLASENSRRGFNRRRDACFLATRATTSTIVIPP